MRKAGIEGPGHQGAETSERGREREDEEQKMEIGRVISPVI